MKNFLLILLISQFFLYSFTLDTKYQKDDSFVWSSHYRIPHILGYSLIGYSLMQGVNTANTNISTFNKTSSIALTSLVLSSLTTETIKQLSGRKRPRYTDSPNDWGYYGNKSFPSGHVASVTSMVVPYMLQYGDEYPAIYLLSLLPVHQMIGRIKEQAHWSSDVIAGLIVGGLAGYYSFYKNRNLLFRFSEKKYFIGFRYRF